MSDNHHDLQQIEDFIRLVKKGDPGSLAELRNQLGKTRKEIADKVGVSEHQLKCWELGEQQPSGEHCSFWKLRLSDYVDEKISTLLGINNAELVTNFWELLWRIDD
jgi:transcriptional regulator with XRE-family HTH domain